MSINLPTIAVTSVPFDIDMAGMILDQVSWIELLNESDYNIACSIGGINFNIPAWTIYPKELKRKTGALWQALGPVCAPITCSPAILGTAGSTKSASLLVTLYPLGEEPAIKVPTPLVRQTWVPNTIGTNFVSATISNEVSLVQTLVIDIGQAANPNLINIYSDGSFSWNILLSGVQHQLLKGQITGSPLLLGDTGDAVEVIGKLLLRNNNPIRIKDHLGSAHDVLYLDTADTLDIQEALATKGICLKDSSANPMAYFSESQGSPAIVGTGAVSVGKAYFTTGAIKEINSGFTNVTTTTSVAHGLTGTPSVVMVTCSQAGSTSTCSASNYTTSHFDILNGSGVNMQFAWLAYR